jgi:hypothetical protein
MFLEMFLKDIVLKRHPHLVSGPKQNLLKRFLAFVIGTKFADSFCERFCERHQFDVHLSLLHPTGRLGETKKDHTKRLGIAL